MKINVIAFGGLGGSVFSAGLKTILLRLNHPQIDFKTYEDYTSWRRWGSTLQSWSDPTVFIGHSYGVAAMFGAIRAMGDKGPQVPLCISFDPSQWVWMSIPLWGSGGNIKPARAKRVVNYYQTNGLIGNQTIAGAQNHKIQGVIHGNIEDSPALQALAVDEIKKVIG